MATTGTKSYIQTTAPPSPNPGDTWWDGSQFRIWDGTAWELVGPGASPGPTPTTAAVFSISSAVVGINARGDLVGAWDSGVTSPIGHGFVCSNRNCFSFDVPGATVTQADDINAHGQVVGTYIDAGGVQHAFLAVGANITSFDFPGAVLTSAWGINSAGQIVGNYRNADNVPHGFLAQPGNKAKPQ